jgi:hypothetical protein
MRFAVLAAEVAARMSALTSTLSGAGAAGSSGGQGETRTGYQ